MSCNNNHDPQKGSQHLTVFCVGGDRGRQDKEEIRFVLSNVEKVSSGTNTSHVSFGMLCGYLADV